LNIRSKTINANQNFANDNTPQNEAVELKAVAFA